MEKSSLLCMIMIFCPVLRCICSVVGGNSPEIKFCFVIDKKGARTINTYTFNLKWRNFTQNITDQLQYFDAAHWIHFLNIKTLELKWSGLFCPRYILHQGLNCPGNNRPSRGSKKSEYILHFVLHKWCCSFPWFCHFFSFFYSSSVPLLNIWQKKHLWKQCVCYTVVHKLLCNLGGATFKWLWDIYFNVLF